MKTYTIKQPIFELHEADGYDVYEVDEVAYWKPVKPPKL